MTAHEKLVRETGLYCLWLREWDPLAQPYMTPDDVVCGEEGDIGGSG